MSSYFNSSVLKRTHLLCAVLLGMVGNAVLGQTNFDDIWSHAVFYEDDENPIVQSIVFKGRFHADWYSFDSNEGDDEDTLWRRFRVGFKNTVLENWTFHFEGDFKLDRSNIYDRLTDAYISRDFSDQLTFKLGKQAAGFTLDGATSSNSLITMERNNLSNNLWFTSRFFTGASLSGETDEGIFYNAGIYSSDGNGEFSHFDASFFGMFSVGTDLSDQTDFDKAVVRLDLVINDEHENANTRDFDQVLSATTNLEKGNWGVSADLSMGHGYMSQSDVWGLVLMPYYNINEHYQIVFRLTRIESSGDNGVRLARYERELTSGRGDRYDEFYAGFNLYLYGHKLKWQTGLKWTEMKDAAQDGGKLTDGFGITSGFRISW